MGEVHDNLVARGLDPSKYHVHIDEEEGVATFYLFGLTGALLGYQTYRPVGIKNTSEGRKAGLSPRDLKYFTHVTRDNKTHYATAVFGMEHFDWRKRTLFVVEGVFDAVKLHSLGHNAIAVLCNRPLPLASFLFATGMRVVGVLDSDPAGELLAEVCDGHVVCPPGKDPGDLTLEELQELLNVVL